MGVMDREKKLLSECMRRSMDELNRKASMTPTEYADLFTRSSETERGMLRGMYLRTMTASVGAGGIGCVIALRATRVPILSGLVGTAAGLAGASVSVASRMPQVLLDVAREDAPSVLADEIVCPAVREFEPCVRDARCRALMSAAAHL